MDLDAFKAAQRRMWADGDYRPIGRALAPAAHILVDRAGVTQGQRVLDVATGAGSVAVAAARAGADVVGLDITDAWFEEARSAAQAARVELALVVGDVERLPVRTEAFDVVLSSFGAIFAPRRHVVGRVGARVSSRWDDRVDGVDARERQLHDDVHADAGLPPPPAYVTPSIRWGLPAHVRDVFASHEVDVVFERPSFGIEFESADAFEKTMVDNSGGFDDLRRALNQLDLWEQARSDFRRAAAQANEANDGSHRVTWDCLLIIAHKSVTR